MSTEIDNIINEALLILHENLDETDQFVYRPKDAENDETDVVFDAIFSLKNSVSNPNEIEDNFMSGYDFDAMLSVLDTSEIEFKNKDLIYRNYDKSTYEVLISFLQDGEKIVLLEKIIKQFIGKK